MSNVVALLPADIYFPQDSISNTFSEKGKYQGANIGAILDKVASGNINIDDFIQDMTVSQTELKKGPNTVKRWASMNNRSLWVVKELQVIGKFTNRKDFQIGEKIPARMKTTNNGGECVVVRKRPISGVSVKPASFWKFYDQMTAPKRLQFLKNFRSVRLQSSYFAEDLTPGPEAIDDDEFSEKQEWFFQVSQPFQQELATL